MKTQSKPTNDTRWTAVQRSSLLTNQYLKESGTSGALTNSAPDKLGPEQTPSLANPAPNRNIVPFVSGGWIVSLHMC